MPRDDFNGDGQSDIFWQNWDHWASVWLATPKGDVDIDPNLELRKIALLLLSVTSMATNGLTVPPNLGAVTVMLGADDGSFGELQTQNYLPLGWGVVGVGDLNNDGHDDIIWQHHTSAFSVWFAQSDGTFDVSAND